MSAITNDTTRARRFYERGIYYFNQSKWVDAASNLRDAVKLYPAHLNARLHLGVALARQRLYLDAIRVLEDGRHTPAISHQGMGQLLRLLAVICMIRQDHPAAEYYLRLAVEGGHRDPATLNKLASVMCKAGRFGDGFDLFLQLCSPRDEASPTES